MNSQPNSNISILLADGLPDWREIIEMVLRKEHFHFTQVTTVRDATTALESAHYDLIISGYKFEDGSGRHIFMLSELVHTPIIFCSTYDKDWIARDLHKQKAEFLHVSKGDIHRLPIKVARILRNVS